MEGIDKDYAYSDCFFLGRVSAIISNLVSSESLKAKVSMKIIRSVLNTNKKAVFLNEEDASFMTVNKIISNEKVLLFRAEKKWIQISMYQFCRKNGKLV